MTSRRGILRLVTPTQAGVQSLAISSVPIGLYLHIPFCIKRCGYCAFATYVSSDQGLWQSYAEALCWEIGAQAQRFRGEIGDRPLASVYFGGGTPSLMPELLLENIVSCVRRYFAAAADAEWTLEAHPQTFLDCRQKPSQLVRMGFNRVSLGIESLQPATLDRLKRHYDFSAVGECVDLLRQAGLKNINFDLIAGWPWESVAMFEQSLRQALTLKPAHLSVYPLTVEEGTPFAQHEVTVDADIEAELMMLAHAMLKEAGYEHYEIANFAKSGHESRHNLLYWRSHDYLACGLSAAGKMGSYYFTNERDLRDYLRLCREGELPVGDNYRVNQKEGLRRQVIMGLRLKEGVKADDLHAVAPAAAIEGFKERGFLVNRNGQIALSPEGWLVSNQLFSACLESRH